MRRKMIFSTTKTSNLSVLSPDRMILVLETFKQELEVDNVTSAYSAWRCCMDKCASYRLHCTDFCNSRESAGVTTSDVKTLGTEGRANCTGATTTGATTAAVEAAVTVATSTTTEGLVVMVPVLLDFAAESLFSR